MDINGLYPVVVQQGYEPDNSPTSSTDINNEWSCSSTPSLCHYGVYGYLSSTWSSRPLYSQSGVHVLGKLKISCPFQSRKKVFQLSTSKPIPCIAEVPGCTFFFTGFVHTERLSGQNICVCVKYTFVVCREFHLVKTLINILCAEFLCRVVHVLISWSALLFCEVRMAYFILFLHPFMFPFVVDVWSNVGISWQVITNI